MDRISAAGNLTIEYDADRWRLLTNGSARPQMLVDAIPGGPLRYVEEFATRRRLPGGELPANRILRVVVGWSQDDTSWHLGLLLGPEIAQSRGSRWCELARWPDPDQRMFQQTVVQAGRALARTLAIPFNLIEPQPVSAPSTPSLPLKELPLHFDDWTLEKPITLQFRRSGRWARSQFVRALWYLLLFGAYLALSVLTLNNIIAPPRPEWLPYLGLAVAVLLLLMALLTLIRMIRQPNRIEITETGVEALRGRSRRWRVTRGDVQSVYVSEVVSRKPRKRTVQHGEINLHLLNGRFRSVLVQQHSVDDPRPFDENTIRDGVTLLDERQPLSELQTAALYMANVLDTACHYDQRLH